MSRYGITVPDRQLACAPADSAEGRGYLGAMAAAAIYGRPQVVQRSSIRCPADDLHCGDVRQHGARSTPPSPVGLARVPR